MARGSIPSAGSCGLFGGAEEEDRRSPDETAPATSDTAAENPPPSGSAVREAGAAAASPALPRKPNSPPAEPAAADLPDTSDRADDEVSGNELRIGEVVARIWIAPFVDANGVYREAAHVRVVLEPAGWRLK